jgi:ABC-type Co2+ transport system permease subunit
VILLVVNIVLGLIFRALPHSLHALGSGLASVISGTLVAPFIALIVTLIYYRLAGDSPVTSPPASGESYGGYQQMLGTSGMR